MKIKLILCVSMLVFLVFSFGGNCAFAGEIGEGCKKACDDGWRMCKDVCGPEDTHCNNACMAGQIACEVA